MSPLTIIPTAEYINDTRLRGIYKSWNKKTLTTTVATTFLRLPLSNYKYKKLSEIPFSEFDFNKKVTMDDIKIECRIKQFVNYLLDHTQLSTEDRKFRFHLYTKIFTRQISNQITSRIRPYLRKQYGFGVYQFDEIKVIRLDNLDEVYSTTPFVLVPTKKFCVDEIKKRYPRSIASDLIQRNTFIRKTWGKIKSTSERELSDQEEIIKALEDWKNEGA